MSGLEIFEAIVTAAKLAKAVLERCKNFKNAPEDLTKLEAFVSATVFTLDAFKTAIENELSTLEYCEGNILPLVEGLSAVMKRLDKQTLTFSSETGLNFVKRLRWTFLGKNGFEAVLAEMKEYRDAFRNLILALKLVSEDDLTQKERSIAKELYVAGGDGVRHAAIMDDIKHGRSYGTHETPILVQEIPEEPIFARDGDRIVTRILKERTVFLEYRFIDQGDNIYRALADVQKLAVVLCNVNAEVMHILRCIATSDRENGLRIALFYEIPHAPKADAEWTLANALKSHRPSLDTRIRYALEIATAVMYTHAAGLVHKSVFPGNVLLLPTDDSAKSLSVFLVGFDAARLHDPLAHSGQKAETDAIKRLYQHPERQNPDVVGRVVRFGIRHDMYSVAVVLLEIGMWSPLALFHDEVREQITSPSSFDAEKLQTHLVKVASERLPEYAGQKYANIVLRCLQGTANNLAGCAEEDVRLLFLDKVVGGLREITV